MLGRCIEVKFTLIVMAWQTAGPREERSKRKQRWYDRSCGIWRWESQERINQQEWLRGPFLLWFFAYHFHEITTKGAGTQHSISGASCPSALPALTGLYPVGTYPQASCGWGLWKGNWTQLDKGPGGKAVSIKGSSWHSVHISTLKKG